MSRALNRQAANGWVVLLLATDFWLASVLSCCPKYQTWGTGTKTAFTLVQVLHRLSTITIPSGISSYFTHEVSPVFLRSAFCTQCQ